MQCILFIKIIMTSLSLTQKTVVQCYSTLTQSSTLIDKYISVLTPQKHDEAFPYQCPRTLDPEMQS